MSWTHPYSWRRTERSDARPIERGYPSEVDADDLLTLVASEPRVTYEPGEKLISVGDRHPQVFVLASGVLQVERDGRVLARFDEGGSITGEIGLLLGSAATADVVAVESSVVHRVDDAERYLDQQPEFARHLAEVLARRLSRVTSYIDDVYRQFEQHGGTLGLVPKVLDDLLGSQRQDVDSGSDASPTAPTEPAAQPVHRGLTPMNQVARSGSDGDRLLGFDAPPVDSAGPRVDLDVRWDGTDLTTGIQDQGVTDAIVPRPVRAER